MDIRLRLIQLGISFDEDDADAIDFAVNRTQEHIKNVCNTDYVPKELEYLAVDMACGEFIKARAVAGILSDEDIQGALKAVTEGDVRVEYDTDKGGFDGLMDILNRGEAELYRFRRLCW